MGEQSCLREQQKNLAGQLSEGQVSRRTANRTSTNALTSSERQHKATARVGGTKDGLPGWVFVFPEAWPKPAIQSARKP